MLLTEESLLASPTFLAFCQAWEADKRCPFGLIDWLWGDMDNEPMAMAAKWAYETWRGHRFYKGHLTPRASIKHHYGWFSAMFTSEVMWDCDINCQCLPPQHSGRWIIFPTFPAAIAWFLLNFDASEVPAETIST